MSLYQYTPAVATRIANPLKAPGSVDSGKQYAYFNYIIWDSSSRLLTFHVDYTADDITLNGLGLRFHYDSTKATYEKETSYGTSSNSVDLNGKGLDDLITIGLKTTSQSSEADSGNLDGSSSTDKFVKVDWEFLDSTNSNEPSWPGFNQAKLYEINLKVVESVTSMEVGFSADNSISSGKSLDSKKVTIDLTSKDTTASFSGAKLYDWKKNTSSNERGDLLKQAPVNFSEGNHKVSFSVNKNNSKTDYFSIDGDQDPTLTLVRGKEYTFDMVGSGHPFYLKTTPNSSGASDEYKSGVTRVGSSNSAQDGDKITFQVPSDAPDKLWYQCETHQNMLGSLNIVDGVVTSDENGLIDLTHQKDGDYTIGYKASTDLDSVSKIKGAVNIDDIMLILKDIGKVASLTAGAKVAADINEDGWVNIDDVMKILKIIGQVEKHADLSNQFVVRDNSQSDPFNNKTISFKSGSSYSLDSYLLGDVDGSWIP